MGLRLTKIVAGFAIVEVAIATGGCGTRVQSTHRRYSRVINWADFGDLIAVVTGFIAVDDAIPQACKRPNRRRTIGGANATTRIAVLAALGIEVKRCIGIIKAKIPVVDGVFAAPDHCHRQLR